MFGVLAAFALIIAACGGASENAVDETPVPSPSIEAEETPTISDSYITLEQYEANKTAYTDEKVVLFFNAQWCSTCKSARANFEANLADFPADLTIVLVDYDTALDLRKTYGVTLQHTFVQVDVNGKELAKWSGSKTIEEVVENID